MLNYNIIKSAIIWKKKQIDKIYSVKELMINNNIDIDIINNYVNDKYKDINIKYDNKVKLLINKNNENKKKEFDSIIRNKLLIENYGNNINKKDIDNLIQHKYHDLKLSNVNFID